MSTVQELFDNHWVETEKKRDRKPRERPKMAPEAKMAPGTRSPSIISINPMDFVASVMRIL